MCQNCAKSGEQCDYSIRLNWGGRSRKDPDGGGASRFTVVATGPAAAAHARSSRGREHVFSAQHLSAAPAPRPHSSRPADLPTPDATSGDAPAAEPHNRVAQRHVQHALGRFPPPYPPPFGPSAPAVPTSHPSPPATNPGDDFHWSAQHGAKRAKLSPPTRGYQQPSRLSPAFILPPFPPPSETSPAGPVYTPHSIGSIMNGPVTPGSSIASGSPYPSQTLALAAQDAPDLRRLSVRSLLSDPSENSDQPRLARFDSSGYRTSGYDHGMPDLDIPRNDDHQALLPRSPDMRRASAAVSEVSSSSGELNAREIAFEPGGYYAEPVPVKIPRMLEPLPEELRKNPMNLLYFHHFINHTGRIMVPHDCPENPFRSVFPLMAVRNPHLLHLMLTYSASHRARLLGHPEPSNRIADWMSDVLPALRQSLMEPTSPGVSDPRDPSSLAPLATAIMLASLNIVSPNTFAVSIPWQQHLQIARQIIIAKGGLHHLAQKADGARDKAIFFLSRWFAYLDVLGSLSGSKQDQPLSGAYLEDGGGLWLVNRSDTEIYQIDCFFGFSGRCISLLAQVAELAGQCDKQRIDPITEQVKAGWRPSEEVGKRAEKLEKRLKASAKTVYRGCMHVDPMSGQQGEPADEKDMEEIFATNEAYHWAGLIHLSRRVFGLPPAAPAVQENVRKVISALAKVRSGSSAEGCLLFPMFSAGCEAQTMEERRVVMERMKAIEGWGLTHVTRARGIMQTVWDTGKPWETIVDGEFLG